MRNTSALMALAFDGDRVAAFFRWDVNLARFLSSRLLTCWRVFRLLADRVLPSTEENEPAAGFVLLRLQPVAAMRPTGSRHTARACRFPIARGCCAVHNATGRIQIPWSAGRRKRYKSAIR